MLPLILGTTVVSLPSGVSSLILSILLAFLAPRLNSINVASSVQTFMWAMDFTSFSLIFLSISISLVMVVTAGSFFLLPAGLTSATLSLLLILILVFSSSSWVIFYLLFESSLIPIIVMIMGWGYQPERVPSGVSMLLYTVIGSLPLLLAIVTFVSSGSSLVFLTAMPPLETWSSSIFTLVIILGFLVKFPMYFLHLWLPKAHVEAPVVGSMILAALLLKLGGYGMLRLAPVCPQSQILLFVQWSSMLGGAMISLVCLQQLDMKVMIAYSSVSHMSFVVASLASNSSSALYAGIMMMLAHGYSSSGMFASANMVYIHSHSRNLVLCGGILSSLPALTALWFVACMANMAAPPTFNLMAEIWSICSIMAVSPWLLPPLSASVFLAVAYSLVIYASTSQSQQTNQTTKSLAIYSKDLGSLWYHAWFIFTLFFLLS